MSKKHKAFRIAASVAAAVAIWLYVDTVKMPSVPMRIRDIPVEFSGENTTLADKGLMLLSGYDTTIDLTLKGPRSQLYKINKEDIRIVADTGTITETGSQSLSYQVVYPDGVAKSAITVDWASAYSVTVDVGELYAKEVPVQCIVNGTPKTGYFAEDPILDNETVTLRGLRDDLLNVSYAEITVDIDGADETYRNAETFTLYDNNDVQVENDAIRPAIQLVQVEVPIKTTKEVPLQLQVQESAGATLENTSYTISPKSVTLAGEKSALEKVESIILDTVYLQDVEPAQVLSYEIPVPENTELRSETTTATVTFTVTGVEEKTVTVTKFVIERMPTGLTGECTTPSIQVTLRGLAAEIKAISNSEVAAMIDCSSLSSAGEYTVPVKILVSEYSHVSAKGTYQVNVKLTAD